MGKGSGGCDRPAMSLGDSGEGPVDIRSRNGTIDRDGSELRIRYEDAEIRAVGQVDLPAYGVTLSMGDDGTATTTAPVVVLHLSGGTVVHAEGARVLDPGVYVASSTRFQQLTLPDGRQAEDEPDDVFISYKDLSEAELGMLRAMVRLSERSPNGWVGRGELSAEIGETNPESLDEKLGRLRRYRTVASDDDGLLLRVSSTGRRVVAKADDPSIDLGRWEALNPIQRRALAACWHEFSSDDDGMAGTWAIADRVVYADPTMNKLPEDDYVRQIKDAEAALEQLKDLGLIKQSTWGPGYYELTRDGYETLAAG